MKIRKKFLQLTKYTYPHGTEGFLRAHLPSNYQVDKFNNYFLKIGENPTTMFTCHLDTASSKQESVKHVIKENIIYSNGKTILGADDKAGMVVLLYMIENNVPGLYYFFIGEEVGCVGSSEVAKDWHNTDFSRYIKRVVSFDRRGTHSVITHQLYGRCCSDEFALELVSRLNSTSHGLSFVPDDTGIFTDSAKFMGIVSECTNISVGYYFEHTHNECQDIEFLQKICKASCEIDWETLPSNRNPVDDFFDFDDEDDTEFSQNFFSYFSFGQKTKKMYISKNLIEKEEKLLRNWIVNQGWPDMKKVIWNGNSLNIQTKSGNIEFIGNRFELSEYVPELMEVSTSDLSEVASV